MNETMNYKFPERWDFFLAFFDKAPVPPRIELWHIRDAE